ncbi:cytochrome P450 monooxygenase protein [Rutstroemia sp. NJR-2017a BBW]|nr:cytochrome P450 monooxygenase protein [Rutstroemia sp. NJR-2017a BBW]
MLVTIISIVLSAFLLWLVPKVATAISSPLNAIPNASITAPFSRLWLLWTRATGTEYSTCLAAHRRLGPVIRIGPKEISINSIDDGICTVHGANWEKSSMYDVRLVARLTECLHNSFSPLFAVRQGKSQSERRRLYTHVYSKSTIINSIELGRILSTIIHDRLLPRLREATTKGDDIDVYSLTKEYSMDVVTAYVYGLGNGTNWTGKPDKASHHLLAFQSALEPWAFFASTEIMRLASSLSWLGIKLISPPVDAAFDAIHSFVLDLTQNAIKQLDMTHLGESDSMGTFKDIWQRIKLLPEEKLNLIASDMVDQTHAGHEATGIILTYVMFELSRHAEVQTRLRNELRSSDDPRGSKMLDAVLMETMRLYPAGIGPFPRVAPANATINGFTIPKGTIATASPYMLGRNSEVFPNPDAWLPERWLKADVDEQRQMRQWVWLFMSGPRNCIGEHLAVFAMKAFIADIYSSYHTTTTGNQDMRQLESFFATPASSSLPLKFHSV